MENGDESLLSLTRIVRYHVSGSTTCTGYCQPGTMLPAPQIRVLLVTAESADWTGELQSVLLATGAFTTVDSFPADLSTPSLSFLSNYTAVLVWQCSLFASASSLGDVLAEYWNGGGSVVATGLASQCLPDNLQGKFGTISNGYMLIDWSAPAEFPADSLGTVLEPESPLMNGVKSLTAVNGWRSTGAVINGGVVVARWASNGRPLVVRGTRAGRPLAVINIWPIPLFPGLPTSWVGNGASLLRNGLLYSVCAPCSAGSFSAAGENADAEDSVPCKM